MNVPKQMKRMVLALMVISLVSTVFIGGAAAQSDSGDGDVENLICDGDSVNSNAEILQTVMSLFVYGGFVVALITGMANAVSDASEGIKTDELVDNMKNYAIFIVILYLIALVGPLFVPFDIQCLFPFL